MDLGRIRSLSEKEIECFKEGLSYRHCNPKRERFDLPYLKKDLVQVIARAIVPRKKQGEMQRFARNLYSAVNKEPLKRVNYGIRSTGQLPFNFTNSLSNWENIYFFRGKWSIRGSNFEEPIDVIAARHMLMGLEDLYRDHYVRKASGEYESQLELPEDEQVRNQCRQVLREYRERKVEEQQDNGVDELRQGRLF